MDVSSKINLDDYQLSCELIGHSMDVRALSPAMETPEGEAIISGSRDKLVKVWKRNGSDYINTLTLQDHSNFISSICYMEREKWICTGSNDTTICIYKQDGYVPILVLKGHESTVCALSKGIEPMSLISGSWDKTARIWVIEKNGTPNFTVLKGHEAAVWAVTTVLSTKNIITGSADKLIIYWNTKGEKIRTLQGHTDVIRGILSLPNGFLVSCANDATIRYWSSDGKCLREINGHSNYIYSIALNESLGNEYIVSGGEDSTLRLWNLTTGEQLGNPIVHPAQSIWAVSCLSNGDIVTGCSDGVVRVFTKDPSRFANEQTKNVFLLAVTARLEQINEELGGVKKNNLPGPEALLQPGTEGQTKMIRHSDGTVKCYNYENGKWNLVGDVMGATGGTQANSGKKLHDGKEYDYVFSVDISDTEPPIKLPYNLTEDPWQAAQKFIHKNALPQAYLDQVANFIIKHSSGPNGPHSGLKSPPSSSGFHDPFTGGSRYVPGTSQRDTPSSGNVDPFTGSSSYTTVTNQKTDSKVTKGSEKHFPISRYATFDNCDQNKVLQKLKEFNSKLEDNSQKVSNNLLEAVIKLGDPEPEIDKTAIEALQHLLRWPYEILFPVLDITRLAVRNESLFSMLNSCTILDIIVPNLTNSSANQLMAARCLANMMCHEDGRRQIEMSLQTLIDPMKEIKTGSANLQIAIATFYLNLTISQTLGIANGDKCRIIAEAIVELLKWAIDLEACYRSFQAIGNLTATPFGQHITAIVISVDYVVDKIRELTNTPQSESFSKINDIGIALLASFQ